MRSTAKKVLHGLLRGSRSPLTPYLLVVVGQHVFPSYPPACFLAQCSTVLVGLDFLGVHPSDWIHEVESVDHYLLCAYVVYSSVHLSVRGPVI